MTTCFRSRLTVVKRLCIIVGSFFTFSAQAASVLPNIIIINADDLGYGDLSSQGATQLTTPHIDQLAKEGIRFTDAHSASSVCTPSRYSMLTGNYSFRKGNLWKPIFLKDKIVIDADEQTIASLLQDAGYNTAVVGKWHLGFGDKVPVDWNAPLRPGPNQRGFDYYFGVPVVNSHPPFVYVENDKVVGYTPDDPFVYGKRSVSKAIPEKMHLDRIGGAEAAHRLYVDEEVGTTLTQKALNWMQSQPKSQPFFLYFAPTAIHHPFTPAKRFINSSQCGLYCDFVHELDWSVGQILAYLDGAGISDSTLVIFTSDNGGMINHTAQRAWQKGHAQNGPLLGFKFDAWEGGHRVPFIARYPGKIPAGKTSSALISQVDLMATFAALTEQTLAPGQGIDSQNVWPALTGQTQQARTKLLHAPFRPSHLSLRSGDWLYIPHQAGGGFNGTKVGIHAFGGPAAITFSGRKNSDIKDGRVNSDAPPAQLYNLKKDMAQTTNLYYAYPQIAAKMAKELAQYQTAKDNAGQKRKKKSTTNL